MVSAILIGWMLLQIPVTFAGASRDPYQHFFDQSLGDFSEELETAREAGKSGVLLFFDEEECPFCYRMKATVLNQIPVQEYYKKHFLIFPVDVEGDVEIVDFKGNSIAEKDFALQQLRVRATPVLAFFNLEGNLVTRYTGATRNAEEFLWLGEYVVDGIYRKMRFTRYKRMKKRGQ
ncbi:MAG: thioredoxin fold domain-containing protein [Gammaproteobacteria bacterium]|nr:thioredoxin fold domain-containing protein [Gammaproteobacteria bacterium]